MCSRKNAKVLLETTSYAMWGKNEKFTLTKKIRQINYLWILLVKSLLSRNFCGKVIKNSIIIRFTVFTEKWTFFRQIKAFTTYICIYKEVSKDLIWRKFLVSSNAIVLFHCAYVGSSISRTIYYISQHDQWKNKKLTLFYVFSSLMIKKLNFSCTLLLCDINVRGGTIQSFLVIFSCITMMFSACLTNGMSWKENQGLETDFTGNTNAYSYVQSFGLWK